MKRELTNQGLQSPPSGDLGGLEVWEFIHEKLLNDIRVMLLYVLQSEGSSPGRKGFKMAVADDGTHCGTIGGGIMEYKFVEKAKLLLRQNEMKVLLQRQYHDKEHNSNQSGMICSGSQVNVFIPLSTIDKGVIMAVFTTRDKTIQLSPSGIAFSRDMATGFQYNTDDDWKYTEPIDQKPVIHIIGGGHVSLAFSELMSFLGFYIKVYDDRPALNTLLQNNFADEKIIIPSYDQLATFYSGKENDYVVIMSVGYRRDKIALKQLIEKDIFYLGLLGSKHKIEKLFNEMKTEGTDEKLLKKVFSPIGLDIASKTSREIAVSIAAEIVRKKNCVSGQQGSQVIKT